MERFVYFLPFRGFEPFFSRFIAETFTLTVFGVVSSNAAISVAPESPRGSAG